MINIVNESSQDEIKGRECSEYIQEFCPDRLYFTERTALSMSKKENENDELRSGL